MFRLRFGFVVIAMVMSVFGVRLVQLQGIDPKAYAAMAAREGSVQVVLPAERGAIADRNGVELATSVNGMMIVADPQMTRDDAPAIATYLADELDLDYFQTLDRLRTGGGSRFVYVARRVPSTLANRVLGDLDDRGYEGLSVRRDPMRDYPSRDVAANLIGFLGEDQPLAGLERTFDAQLSGTDGEATYEVGGGNRIPLGNNTTVKPHNGTDLRLTIDRDVQWYVQRVLRSTVRGANGDSGVAVVMDSRTGELLSLADYPSFDAQTPLSSPKDDLGSRALSDVYEPGSVEKVLTASALIDAGKLSPLTHIQVPSELPRPGAAPLRDHWDHALLHYTLAGVISRSSNIGTVLAARKFTPEELHGYLTSFGLGQRTDIGVRGETAGLLADPSLWAQGNQDTIAFGQGLSVNAVQMAAAVNTVANRGVRVDPSLIRGHATTDDGTVVGTDTVSRHRVISARAARQTMLMMELVTDVDDGVAPGAAIPGYRVAGKTGTAQRAGKDGRYDDTYTVSFAGFAPADKPRFTVYVLVQNPRNGGGGGSVAGPAFSRIMSYLLRRYAVPPTGTKPSTYPVEY
jgi:cell division protein FtsI (penicillin-binding protein 3)